MSNSYFSHSILLDLPSPQASSVHWSLMKSIGWLLLLPFVIQSCSINDILLKRGSTDVIFVGRILSLHRWSSEYPYSAFVSLFRILSGEKRLLKHYSWKEMQYPLYIIVDHLQLCNDVSISILTEDQILGIRIHHGRFYSSFPPLLMTVPHLQTIEGKGKSHSASFSFDQSSVDMYSKCRWHLKGLNALFFFSFVGNRRRLMKTAEEIELSMMQSTCLNFKSMSSGRSLCSTRFHYRLPPQTLEWNRIWLEEEEQSEK